MTDGEYFFWGLMTVSVVLTIASGRLKGIIMAINSHAESIPSVEDIEKIDDSIRQLWIEQHKLEIAIHNAKIRVPEDKTEAPSDG